MALEHKNTADFYAAKSSWGAVKFQFMTKLFWGIAFPFILLIIANCWNNSFPARHGFPCHTDYVEGTKTESGLWAEEVTVDSSWYSRHHDDNAVKRISEKEAFAYWGSWALIVGMWIWVLCGLSGIVNTNYQKDWRFKIFKKTKTVMLQMHFFFDRRPSKEFVCDRLVQISISRPTVLTWAGAGGITIHGMRLMGARIDSFDEFLGIYEDPEEVAREIMKSLPLHEEFKIDIQHKS